MEKFQEVSWDIIMYVVKTKRNKVSLWAVKPIIVTLIFKKFTQIWSGMIDLPLGFCFGN